MNNINRGMIIVLAAFIECMVLLTMANSLTGIITTSMLFLMQATIGVLYIIDDVDNEEEA